MIDTIKVKWLIDLPNKLLKLWDHSYYKNSEGVTKHKYIYNYPIDNYTYRFTFYPFNFTGDAQLNLEISVPKAVFGNNYTMVLDIPAAIATINQKLKTVPAIPPLDLGEGILIRLDICHNYYVGDMVEDYLQALSNLEYPHRKTQYHRHDGVVFRSQKKKSKFYDKYHETQTIEAYGFLRQEITLQEPKDIQKFLDKRKPTLLDVTLDKAVGLLQDDLKVLGLYENSIATRDLTLKTLCKAYGSDAGIYYTALLMLNMDKSKAQIAQEAQIHPRSLDRKLKKIKDAGISLTLTTCEEPLPPLSITYDDYNF